MRCPGVPSTLTQTTRPLTFFGNLQRLVHFDRSKSISDVVNPEGLMAYSFFDLVKLCHCGREIGGFMQVFLTLLFGFERRSIVIRRIKELIMVL